MDREPIRLAALIERLQAIQEIIGPGALISINGCDCEELAASAEIEEWWDGEQLPHVSITRIDHLPVHAGSSPKH